MTDESKHLTTKALRKARTEALAEPSGSLWDDIQVYRLNGQPQAAQETEALEHAKRKPAEIDYSRTSDDMILDDKPILKRRP